MANFFFFFFYHRVYDELTIDYLSIWLDSSVDRALHRNHKVMGSSRVQARIFFTSHHQPSCQQSLVHLHLVHSYANSSHNGCHGEAVFFEEFF